jgi:hypothetical protein
MSEAVADIRVAAGDSVRPVDRSMLSNPTKGIAWVVAIPIGATVSFLVSKWVWDALDIGPTPLMSIGTALIGAAILTTFALAGQKPFDAVISEARTRAAVIMAVSLVLAGVFWGVFTGWFDVSMPNYAFPVIGTVWWFIAATSFVGEDAHVASLSPPRRTLLNVVLWTAGTALVVGAITWIPPFWFGFVQTLLVTGGFAYLLRRVAQPAKSAYAWAVLVIATGVALIVSNLLGVWNMDASVGPWSIGSPTAEWGIFFGLWCGLNYGVLAPLQNWPFSRVQQPWGTTIAVFAVIAWSVILTYVLRGIFEAYYDDKATALLEAQVWAWHTVPWGFAFALLFQKTRGTWDDVD